MGKRLSDFVLFALSPWQRRFLRNASQPRDRGLTTLVTSCPHPTQDDEDDGRQGFLAEEGGSTVGSDVTQLPASVPLHFLPIFTFICFSLYSFLRFLHLVFPSFWLRCESHGGEDYSEQVTNDARRSGGQL